MAAPVSTVAPSRQNQAAGPGARSKKSDTETAALEWQPQRSTLPLVPDFIPVDSPSSGDGSLPTPDNSLLAATVPSATPATDPLEAEAEATAEQLSQPAPATTPRSTGDSAPPLRRLEEDYVLPAAIPPHVRDVLRSPGETLEPSARESMEQRFGWSFAGVRIHTGQDAAESAAALNARAYAVGRHIVFGSEGLQPDTQSGRRLLAHELTHVTRQSIGIARGRIQADGTKGAAPKPKVFRFKIKIDHAMKPEELLRAFIRQYYNLTSDTDVEKKVPIWHWQNPPGRSATEEDAKKGFIILPVLDHQAIDVENMSKEDQGKLNKETDERFWAKTGYKPGQTLGKSAKDQEMARQWLGVRADVLLEREQLQTIQNLSDDIKQILFAGGRPLTPDDYPRILALADKLARLTPSQRADYIAKVNSDTDSFEDMNKSIDRYMVMQKVEENEEEITEQAAEKLFGLDDLYRLYRAREGAQAMHTATVMMGGDGTNTVGDVMSAEKDFQAALTQNHFNSEKDFLDLCEAYRLRFRSEAVHIAMEVLARYEHKLFLAKKKFQDPANVATLVQNIAASGAQQHYQAAEEKSDLASNTRMGADPENHREVAKAATKAAEYTSQSKALHATAEGEVVTASGNDSIVDPEQLGRGTDREKLSKLDTSGAQQYLLQVINERYADIDKARREFAEDPDRVFSQPGLIQATKESQQAGKDSIYSMIVDDYVAKEERKHLFTAIVIGIIALILAALVPGGGWVAAAALIASATISTVQAIESIKEYQEKETDYRLNFINDEPSLAWVAVAVVAAALDLGMAASAVFKMSAAGLKTLEAPLKEFSAITDAEAAASRLQKLTEQIDAVEGLQKEVKDALKARAAAEVGLKKALGKTMNLMGSVGGMVDPTPLFEAFYYGIKKGANTITKLRNEAQIVEVMGDVTKMTGASRQELTNAFEQVKKVVSIGQKRGMDEETVLKYVDRLAAQRSGGEGAFEVITEEMSAWRKPTASQIAAEKGLGEADEALASLKEQRAKSLAELRTGPKKPDGTPDTDRIKELRDDIAELEDQTAVDRSGREYVKREGEISKARRAVSEAEKVAEKERLDPKVLMRRAFGGSKERADKIAGITADQVGVLKTKPAALSVDHVVSIKQISEMEGFEKLTVKERNYLATLEDNLVVMDGSANSSKGERAWSAWKQAGNFYNPDVIAKMVGEENRLRSQIQSWIQNTVKGR